MVRDTRAALHEHVARPLLAVGNEYASGYLHEPHRHRRSQLPYAEYGTMAVDTEEGGWLVPPHEALWIPAGVVHSIKMLSRVATRSVYFGTGAANLPAPCCQVVGVSPLLRQLLIEAADIPAEYEPASRAAKNYGAHH